MFFKKTPLIEYWSYIQEADSLANITPISPASNYMPVWYANMPTYQASSLSENRKFVIGKGTVKACPGIRDYITSGLIIPSWCDFYFKVTSKDITYQTPDNKFEASMHNNNQLIDHLPIDYKKNKCCVMKLVSPWRIKVSKGYKLYYLPPYFNNIDDNIEVIPGIRESSVYFTSNIFLLFKQPGEYFIKRGAPLSLIVPIKKEVSNIEYILPNSSKHNAYRKKDHDMQMGIHTKFSQGFKKFMSNYCNKEQ